MQEYLFEEIEEKLNTVIDNIEDEPSRREIREAQQFVVCLEDQLDRERGR